LAELKGKGNVVIFTMPKPHNCRTGSRYRMLLSDLPGIKITPRNRYPRRNPELHSIQRQEIIVKEKDKVYASSVSRRNQAKMWLGLLDRLHVKGKGSCVDTDPETLDWIRRAVLGRDDRAEALTPWLM